MLVEVSDVSFRYRKSDSDALTGLSLRAEPGRILAVLGHNGAGKSTLLGLLSGLRTPQGGEVRVGGRSPRHPDVWGAIGHSTDQITPLDRLTVHDYLRVLAKAFRLEPSAVEAHFQQFGLNEHSKRRVGALSTGYRGRLRAAIATVHDPTVVLLDEPLAGMDPISVESLLEMFRRWTGQGRTVVIASHDLHELETVADDVLVLRQGRSVAWGSMHDLLGSLGGGTVTIDTAQGHRLTSATDDAGLPDLLRAVTARGDSVIRISTQGQSLSDLYRALHAEDAGSPRP